MPKCKSKDKQNDDFQLEPSSGNVFKDIGFNEDEAINLSVRAQLISTLRDLIEESGMSQREMSIILKVKQPRIAEIMKMKIQFFSIDTLLKYLDILGRRVSLVVERKRDAA
jgi:predicted XRE-type DNA-binding protein